MESWGKMKKIFRANLYFLIILLLSIFAPEGLHYVYKALGVKDVRIVLTLNHFIIFLVPAIIYTIVTKSKAREVFRLNPIKLKNVGLLVLLGLALQPVVMFLGLLSSMFFTNEIGGFIQSISGTHYLALLLLIAGTPAITEEVTLRGVILSGYDFKNKWVASAMIGIFFGIFHLNAQQFLYAAILGMILAYLVRITNSIFASAIVHFMINGFQVSMLKLSTAIVGNIKVDTNAVKNLSLKDKLASLSSSVVMALIFLAISIIIIKKIQENCREQGIIDSYEKLVSGNEERIIDRTVSIKGNKDNIFNAPFVAIVIIYLIYMNISSIIRLFIK